MNLEDRIRSSIDRQTDAAPAESLPPGLRRRARRRIAATVAGALIAVTAVSGGTVALIRAQEPGRTTPGDTPSAPPPSPSSHITTTPSSPPPSIDHPAARLIEDFMQARLSGSGADAFLSESGAQQYGAPGARPPLYGDESMETRFGEYSVDAVEEREDGSWTVLVRIQMVYPGDTPVCPVTEGIAVGPGTDPGGTARDLLVLGSSLYAAGWEYEPLTSLAAQEFVCYFMGTRLEGPEPEHFASSAAELLSDAAKAQYERGAGGLELYPTEPHAGFWWIVAASGPLPDGTVQIEVTYNNTGQPDAVYESLHVGWDPGGPVLIQSAAVIPQD